MRIMFALVIFQSRGAQSLALRAARFLAPLVSLLSLPSQRLSNLRSGALSLVYMGTGVSALRPFGTGFDVRCVGCAELRDYQVICPEHDTTCMLLVPGTGAMPD